MPLSLQNVVFSNVYLDYLFTFFLNLKYLIRLQISTVCKDHCVIKHRVFALFYIFKHLRMRVHMRSLTFAHARDCVVFLCLSMCAMPSSVDYQRYNLDIPINQFFF